MARINIEDSLLLSPQFRALERRIGRRLAIGTLYDLFRLSQFYWCKYNHEVGCCDKSPIPKQIYILEDFPPELIEFGIVEEVDGGFYVRGSDSHFSWLVQKTESGAKGGRSSKNNNLTKAVLTPRLSSAYAPLPPPTPTPTPVLNNNNKKTKPNGFDKTDLVKAQSPKGTAIAERGKPPDKNVGHFIKCYITAYTARYGARPDLSGKRQGQIKNLVAGCESFEELCQLIQAYLQISDPWFIKKMHDIQTFAENIGKVRVLMHNGLDSPDFEAKKQAESFWDSVKLD